MNDLEELKDEIQWAITNNAERPRTELALRRALEAIEELEREATHAV